VTLHSSQVKSCVTDKHNTKYNTFISEQPYIHARWSIFTFPGQNEPRPGHGTLWVNSGTIPAIPGRLVLGLRGVLCAIICPLILPLDPRRGPIGDWKNLGRHSRCGAERCNSRWRPRWPPHPYTQYNSIWICPAVMNLVFLPRFLGSRNPLKSFSEWKK